MKISGSNCLLIILLCFVAGVIQIDALNLTCTSRLSPCFLHPMPCPSECPTKSSANPKAKVCYVNCKSPVCQAECKREMSSLQLFQFHFHDVNFFGCVQTSVTDIMFGFDDHRSKSQLQQSWSCVLGSTVHWWGWHCLLLPWEER